ncbi:Ubiquitin-protein ligase E3B [Toxocara canis]|uniref:Ubiquitin-protein ligase E3B n=1 Tax=Toxocara canis TaxID=6265 RepID=A0A0B2VTV4_TOXCA|nr:Ubiquitin-protein ligase E3B [Toxocara canis]
MECDQRRLFIEQTAREREQRLHLKEGINALIWLQAFAKGSLQRRKFGKAVREDFDALLDGFIDLDKERELPECKEVHRIALLFVRLVNFPDDTQRFSQLCRYLVQSMSSMSMQHSFAALLLSKNHIQSANRLISAVLALIPEFADKLQMEKVADGKSISLFVHFAVTFSSCNSWAIVRNNAQISAVLNQMCNKTLSSTLCEPNRYAALASVLGKMVASGRLSLPSSVCNGLFSILFRLVKNANFAEAETSLFIQHCLVCPALLTHLSQTSMDLLVNNGVFGKAVNVLSTNTSILRSLTGNETLFLLANLVHLSYIDQIGLIECLIEWTNVMNKILAKCDEFVVKKQGGSRSHWHPIFGWYCKPLSHSIEGSLPLASKQLQYLWSKPVVTCLFDKVLHCGESQRPNTSLTTSVQSPNSQIDLTTSIQKLWKKLNSVRAEAQPSNVPQPLPPLSMTAVVCQLYQNALLTLSTLHSDILAGLCREDFLLPQLWEHIVSLSPQDSGLSYLLSLLSSQPPTIPHFAPLILFANSAASVISILDEEEMYEKGGPFTVEQLCAIAKFCNRFCFRAIWNGYLGAQQASCCPLFSSVYQLCMLLYNRDCRRSFTKDPKFWLAPEVKSSTIMSEFEKKTERAHFLISRMSHLVVLHERILLFRKYIAAEKETLEGAPNTMITVERTRLVEDGYRQLSMLSSNALKATIRVKFINQQGLDEAGIDQDGVFKEFLELTLKRVFHPDLNLFKTSPSRQLFPSPTSNLHEDHLALFQFVGRMLAKAIYEGIVVEVHLAPVLLATVLGRRLCAFDELSQLDPDLYKSLTYVKHYSDSGDVADLSLTFSTDEDVLGRLHTVDLVPGGRTIQVTNENKIAYVHKMAQYRVFDQTKEQCRAFVSGFLSILNANWLSLFAPHELQFLISGQSSDIDLRDLRKHVQYYGGFHSNHRLIKWLWQILECDFSVEERHLFLKFVTSCSRAPLLGFAYLEPPFSIRCVEVSDDQDQGDTLASVVRGFLAIKRTQSPTRLPTSSTCFNLLKLPNYSKKSILLQKLRYAIHSETGFELS